MHKIGANSIAVDGAGFFGGFAGQSLQVRLLQRFEQTERVKRGFQIAPAAESAEYALALYPSRNVRETGHFREAVRRGLLGRLRRFFGTLFFESCTVCHKSCSVNVLF